MVSNKMKRNSDVIGGIKARVSHSFRNSELAQSSAYLIMQKGEWRTREERTKQWTQNWDPCKQGVVR